MTDITLNTVLQTLGWFGTTMFVIGYWLVSTGRVSGEGLVFQGLNIGGSIGLGLAAFGGRVWASVALNLIWLAIGVPVVVRLLVRRRRDRDGATVGTPLPPA